MKSAFYNFQSDDDLLVFKFQSVSKSKTINKVVVYSPIPNNTELYNLALGDILENDEVSDLTVSNNSDLEKIIATIVQTMFRFFEKYPQSYIYFKGSTPERTRLYRIIISKEYNEATKIFKIYGIFDEKLQPFELNCPYESFVIALKKQII